MLNKFYSSLSQFNFIPSLFLALALIVICTLCVFSLRLVKHRRAVSFQKRLAGWLAGFTDDVSFSLPEIN